MTTKPEQQSGTKHTPGPWEQTGNMIVKFGEDGRCICQMSAHKPEFRMIQHVTPDFTTITDPELQANARLIADAPRLKQVNAELLEALEGISRTAGMANESSNVDPGNLNIIRSIYKQAEAAIRRARERAQ